MSLKNCLIRKQALKNPSLIAIETDTQKLSYKELDKKCNDMCTLLHQELNYGDTIAIISTPNIETICLLFACFRNGITAGILNHKWPTQKITDTLHKINAKKTLTNEPRIITQLPKKERLDLHQKITTKTVQETHLNGHEVATYLASSGSTGTEKIIAHQLRQHTHSAENCNERLSLKPDDKWLHTLPYYHVSGLSILFRCFMAGARVILSTHNLQTSLNQFFPTHLSLVLPQLKQLIGDDYRLEKYPKNILLGGSHFPERVLKKAIEKKLPIRMSYGSTETSSFITCTNILSNSDDISLSGTPNKTTEIKLSPEHELLLKGPSLCHGYLDKNQQVQSATDSNEWFHTKDIAELHDNQLKLIGRMDNQFISGGENIYPETVENILREHPDINYAMIIPIKNDDYGNVGCAYIQSNKTLDEKFISDIKKWLDPHITNFQCPKEFNNWPNHIEPTKTARKKLAKL